MDYVPLDTHTKPFTAEGPAVSYDTDYVPLDNSYHVFTAQFQASSYGTDYVLHKARLTSSYDRIMSRHSP